MNQTIAREQQKILTEAYNKFEKSLKIHAFFKLRDSSTSDDLVQETFKKTWIYLVKGGKVHMMKAFLYHILNNLIIDEYRKRKHSTTSLETLVEKGFEPVIGDSKRLFDIIDGKAAAPFIKNLPSLYRKAVQMRFIDDLSLKEISIVTKQSKNAVAVQVHRGLEKLRTLYNTQKNHK